MATSGSTDFSITAGDILKDAASLVISVDSTQGLVAEHKADLLRMLNMLIKSWQTKVELWPTIDVTVTLTPGTQSYTVGTAGVIVTPRPLQLLQARRRASSIDTQINVVSRQEYMMQPNKATQAPVNIVYYDPQLTNGVLYVWPTGTTTNNTIICTFKRPIEDFDSLANTPDFPQEWYLPLVYNLAVIIAPMFGFPAPQEVVATAGMYLDELMAFDTEDTSIFLQPYRMY